MHDWKDYVSRAHLIFLATPGNNAKLFYGYLNSLEAGLIYHVLSSPYSSVGDRRVRKVPFTTSRPTFSEVTKIFYRLTTISVEDAQLAANPTSLNSPSPKAVSQFTEKKVSCMRNSLYFDF